MTIQMKSFPEKCSVFAVLLFFFKHFLKRVLMLNKRHYKSSNRHMKEKTNNFKSRLPPAKNVVYYFQTICSNSLVYIKTQETKSLLQLNLILRCPFLTKNYAFEPFSKVFTAKSVKNGVTA